MKILKFKKHFSASLKDEYPTAEINSFFNILAKAYLDLNRLQLALAPETELTSPDIEKFKNALFRLKNHEPIQYIIGETEFYGITFEVDKGVLIPRPETEELVAWIISEAKNNQENLKILDIGTGSGCIAISLAKNLENSEVYAMELSEDALKIAEKNAVLNEVEIKFLKNDIFGCSELPGFFDIIVSNPPYVRELEKVEMQPNVLKNEPGMALYVKDEDPLLFYKQIIKLSKPALNKNGKLYFEINQYLAMETEYLLKNEGFETELRKDIFGNFRMLKGILKKQF